MTREEVDKMRARWQRRHDAIARALVGALRDGSDVAELVVSAATDAEKRVAREGRSLIDNRSGSWEASMLSDMLQAGGAYVGEVRS